MKNRFFLIVAVLAGAGVLLLTQLVVRPRLQVLVDQRARLTADLTQEKGERLRVQQQMAENERTLAAVSRSLEEAQAGLKAAADREQQLAAASQTELAKAQAARLAAEQETAKQRRAADQAWAESNLLWTDHQDLLAKNDALEKELAALKTANGPFPPPPLDLRGRVVAVDPKWNFVVLDIGKPQQAHPTWTFVVSRNGRLVGKVQITSVTGDRSIANILPGWKLDELAEGDQVMPEMRVPKYVGNLSF